jgi:Phospholipase_D-nuclease N-terminal
MVRYFLPFLVELVLVMVALISCLSADEGELRALPKIVWVFIILLFPIVGPIAYLIAGRPVATAGPPRSTWRPGNGFPEAERPRPVAPDDDPEFLRSLRAQQRDDTELLRKWEEDLRRREEDLRQRQRDEHPDGEPPR